MTSFDRSQEQALALDPGRHARVLGAPGSGKTALVVESYARAIEREGWGEDDVLVLAPNRLVATRLRDEAGRRVDRALGGAPARTASSFAFSILGRSAALAGTTPPRLLTGTVQDEAIAEAVLARLEAAAGAAAAGAAAAGAAGGGGAGAGDGAGTAGGASGGGGASGVGASGVGVGALGGSSDALAPEVLLSAPFRAELRELWRVLDDFGLSAGALSAELAASAGRASGEAFTELPDPGLVARWIDTLALLDGVAGQLARSRPDELSASGLLRRAASAVREGEAHPPRLLIVDDAQELGEGQLALLAACAGAGSAVWAFGDPDIATGAFQGERTRVLSGLHAELERRGWEPPPGATEQLVVLDSVYRHGPVLRGFVSGLTGRIGAAGASAQRAATAAFDGPAPAHADGAESAAGDGDAAQPEDTAVSAAVSAAGGATGAAVEDAAVSGVGESSGDAAGSAAPIQFARVGSASEQLGAIAHRMRARKLGLDGVRPLGWTDMAVVCRTRAEAVRIARLLSAHQVPTGIAAGGVVLREHQVVRELIALLQHALDIARLDVGGVLALAGGVLGGLDPVAVRRLRGALLLEERRVARDEDRDPASVDEVVFDAFAFPGPSPAIDSAGGRAIRRLGLMAAEGDTVHRAGGTPREVLWALWDRAKLAERWQQEALGGRGARADEANRSLDAVMGLFFALQRHEEQDSEQPIAELLEELLRNTVPEDSLAQRSERDAVTVTTPQGVIGREFALVAVVGVQDGSWPNLRARGSLLGTAALERWLRGGQAVAPSRRDTIHDELRLFAHACARAREELLVVATADEDSHPSPFFGFGAEHRADGLPSARLTLRGATATLRRRLVADPDDAVAARSLAALAAEQVAGAHPDEWYGVMPPSSDTPLYAQPDGEQPRPIPVSPSQLDRAETCGLDWVISALGGSSGSVQASLGTLVHHALETAEGEDAEQLLAAITAEWAKLPFDAAWESERARRTAARMAQGLADYLAEFERSDRVLLGRESSFSLEIGRAELRGIADRLELRRDADGAEVTVVDLKTGRTPATKAEAEAHVQLQSYQLGVALGAFTIGGAEAGDGADSEAAGADSPAAGAPSDPAGALSDPAGVRTAAKLLYVHPDAAKGKGYAERVQAELDAEGRERLTERVLAVAETMAAGHFTARIEHHCSDPHQPGNCRLHIIQAVSHA